MLKRKLYTGLSVLLLLILTASPAAAQSCGSMNIQSSGGWLAPDQFGTVYSFNVRCLATHRFTFQDLSGNRPQHSLEHRIEQNTGGSWRVISSTTSRNARQVTRTFTPTSTGEYRYRVLNIGDNTVRNWSMTGRIPTISFFPMR